ncbi:MAG: murein biosynthesis integral membrane protein MurJ [Proteobacteria bacterium]|nr:murein biosynthesis integral membrane protein MurJ [Desulfocapsa sp.]MBU3944288.1 murein biosynthesis integral membrane protein MurJ [Pseudomonadota bacterium]MCG2745385.1 murein biosynthesis integral membrane protein MurJ [Desulfobacteraceae bacterium]MBU3983157.1 murein biosynthesis integral membrane protein MurJ [Pseudomonadota bacterium]MBU4030147.1 murein biosynthesis integral membrane protein MurJ [Pseudomonadota bacterium]
MKEKAQQNTAIAKSAGTVGIAVMCSRVLGLVREQIFAAMFGAGYAYDSFVVAFRIPNLLRDLFGEGALSAAFVTIFSRYDTNKTQEETWRLASNVLVFFAILLSLLTLLGIFMAGPLVSLLAPDFSKIAGKAELTATLTMVMMPFLVFISLAAVVMGMLNTKGRFFVPAMASSFFNLGSIVGGVSMAWLLPRYGYPAIVGMAIGTLVGGILQLGVQLPALFKTGFRFFPHLDLKDPGLHSILRLMIPATIGLSATQINIFVNTSFAASCAEGSVSWLNYAFRLVQLPIGIFGVAFSIAVMPVMARHAAKKDVPAMRDTLVSSLTMVFCLTIPATAGLVLLAEPIIRLIFERGAFTAFDTVATAQTLTLYAIGLFAYSANKILVPVFYALDDTRYPVMASFLAVLANIVIINLTITVFQHKAIALSTSCTMFLNFLFLSAVLYRKMDGYPLRALFRGVSKILIATSCMSLLLFFARMMLAGFLVGNLAQQLLAVLLMISLAAGLYTVVLHWLKLPELTEIVDKVRAKFC